MHSFDHVPLISRKLLNEAGSDNEVYHLVLDLSQTSLTYSVGDCLQVFPTNSPELVARILRALKFTGDERVEYRGASLLLADFLLHKANLSKAPKADCELDFADFVESEPFPISPKELPSLFSPLLPRSYSIASAMSEVGHEAHLLVKKVSYLRGGKLRSGVASSFLCEQAPLNVPHIPVAIMKKPDFTLAPESHEKPIIMIGAGTGMAPFLGFMQERHRSSAAPTWFIFGERRALHDFYFEPFWRRHHLSGKLKLDLAFSRDQEEKIYVQHRLLEKSSEIFGWLNRDALLFVSGDAKRMAKEVDSALIEIVKKEANTDDQAALEFLRKLRREKRYLRDVY